MAKENAAVPAMVCVVGRKNAGKTTLVVRLTAELSRRGHRVMTLKHGSHTFNLDPATTDTYRHYHEGNAERVAMASPDKFALVERWDRELPPEEIAARYLSDADIVVCEGYKASTLPKVEIHRAAAHGTRLWEPTIAHAATWRAMVSDVAMPDFPGAVFELSNTNYLDALVEWTELEIIR